MNYWVGHLKTKRFTRKAPRLLPDSERLAPPSWPVVGSTQIAVGDRVFFWRSSLMNRAVGLAEVRAVALGGDGAEDTVALDTVEPLEHMVPRGPDPELVSTFAVFNKAGDGLLAQLSLPEAHLLFRHLALHNPRVLRLAWFDDDTTPGAEPNAAAFDPSDLADGRRRTLRALVQRQGQSQFREALLAAYGGRCAMSGCATTAVLEAAHIVPFRGSETNHVQNGLLLRADLHTLFDLDLLTIDPDSLVIDVHEALRDSDYATLNGKALRRPKLKRCWPSSEALRQRKASLAPAPR